MENQQGEKKVEGRWDYLSVPNKHMEELRRLETQKQRLEAGPKYGYDITRKIYAEGLMKKS